MTKKGQTQQIFVWVFILIVAVSVLFFGIKVLNQSEDLKDEVLLVDFFKKLDKKMGDFYYLDVDSVGFEEFILPVSATEVCFYDENTNLDLMKDNEKFISTLTEFSDVFVFSEVGFRENRHNLTVKFEAKGIPLVPNPDSPEKLFCGDVNGGLLRLKFTNQGIDGVLIEQ
jgi:hypothetical protein